MKRLQEMGSAVVVTLFVLGSIFLLQRTPLAEAQLASSSSSLTISQEDLSSLVTAISGLTSYLSTLQARTPLTIPSATSPSYASLKAEIIAELRAFIPSGSSRSTDGLADSLGRLTNSLTNSGTFSSPSLISPGLDNPVVSGNLGVGISSPNNTIQVKDLINFDNTDENTYLGYQAANADVDIIQSVFLGYQAGLNTTTGDFNVFVGRASGLANTTGFSNVAMGLNTLVSNTTGDENTAIGTQALTSNTTGHDNVAIGNQALLVNLGESGGHAFQGSFNTAIGWRSMLSNTTGHENTAIGELSMSHNTTGVNNVGLGGAAMDFNTTGSANTAVGKSALYRNTTGGENTAVGYFAGGFDTAGAVFSSTTVMGAFAGTALTTGSRNILIGYKAGDAITTGTNNIIIGQDIDATSTTASYYLNIGNTIYGDVNSKLVGINQSNPQQTLTVAGSLGLQGIGTGAGTAYLCTTLATGVVSTSTSACNPSSLRFKENIQDLTYSQGLETVRQLRPVSYTYKPELLITGNQIGFIAEEVDLLIPEIVGKDASSTPANIDYAKIAPVLVKAIQELDEKVNATSTQTITDASGLLDTLAFAGGSIVNNVIHFVELVVDKLTAKEVHTEMLCVGTVCVSEAEFQAVFGQPTPPPPSAPTPESEPEPEPVPDSGPPETL